MIKPTVDAPVSHTLPVPPLIESGGAELAKRFVEFFDLATLNSNTRRDRRRAVADFIAYCEAQNVGSLFEVRETHVAAYIRCSAESRSTATIQGQLAAIRRLFEWLVAGGVIDVNPAEAVHGPKHNDRGVKAHVLEIDEAQALIEGIDDSTAAGMRDRAMIAVMVYAFARVGLVISLKVGDVVMEEGGGGLHLKGVEVPHNHPLVGYLHAYIDGCHLSDKPDAPLFQSIKRGTGQPGGAGQLSGGPLLQSNIFKRVRQHASAIGITDKVSNDSFRATALVDFLKKGGALEAASVKANHKSIRATRGYQRLAEKKKP